jgi:hypothetical protein
MSTSHFFVDTGVFPEPKSFKVPVGADKTFSVPEVVLDANVIPKSICTCDYENTYPIVLEIKPMNYESVQEEDNYPIASS